MHILEIPCSFSFLLWGLNFVVESLGCSVILVSPWWSRREGKHHVLKSTENSWGGVPNTTENKNIRCPKTLENISGWVQRRQNHLWKKHWIMDWGTNSLRICLRLRRDVKLFWATVVHTWQTRETSEKNNKGLNWTFQLHTLRNFSVLWKVSWGYCHLSQAFPKSALARQF